MRIKNKEIRKRRHRKEQVIKEARRETLKLYGDKPKPVAAAAPAEKAPKAKKAAPEAEPKKTTKKAPKAEAAPEVEVVATETEATPKPKAKRAPKKAAEETPAE